MSNENGSTVQPQFASGCSNPIKPINYWANINGIERLLDGRTKAVRFSIQEIPSDRYEEVISHMLKYFIIDEVTCICFKFSEDKDALADFQLFWRYLLKQGVSIGAYKVASNNTISELVAVNLLSFMTAELVKDIENIMINFNSKNAKKLFKFMHEKSEIINVCDIYGVDKYITSFGLSVAPTFRGQKLGVHLLQARNFIGQKYGITATSTLFTAPASQIQAERAGFKTVFAQKYSEVLDKYGNPLFPNISAKEFKVMIKQLH